MDARGWLCGKNGRSNLKLELISLSKILKRDSRVGNLFDPERCLMGTEFHQGQQGCSTLLK